MRLSLLAMVLFLSGCASNHLGQYADVVAMGGGEAAIKMTGRFNPVHCSDYFAYIDLSVENKTAQWKTLSNLELHFPYGSDDEFAIIEGERLVYWVEGERNRLAQNNHNDALASLAVATLGLGLAATGDKKAAAVGAALYTGVLASKTTKSIYKNVSRAETADPNGRNYLFGQPIMIPPGMTRKFWLVLSATEQAPLMAGLGGTFRDSEKKEYAFKMTMENWGGCQWQQARKRFLRDKVKQDARPAKTGWAGDDEFDSVKVNHAALIRAEHEIQTLSVSAENKQGR